MKPGSCNPTTSVDASASAVYVVMFDKNPLCGQARWTIRGMDVDGYGSGSDGSGSGSDGSGDGDVVDPTPIEAPPPPTASGAPPSSPVDAPPSSPVDVPPRSPVDAPPRSPVDAPPSSPVDAPPGSPIPPKKGNDVVTVTLVFAVDSSAYNATLLEATVRAQFAAFADTVEVTLGALVLSGARHLLAAGSVTVTVALTGADATAVRAYADSPAFLSACAAAGVTGVTVTVTSEPTTPLPTSSTSDVELLGLLALLVIPVAGAGYFVYYKMQQRKAGSSSKLEHVLITAPEEPPEAQRL
jgi:hypothetical protein